MVDANFRRGHDAVLDRDFHGIALPGFRGNEDQALAGAVVDDRGAHTDIGLDHTVLIDHMAALQYQVICLGHGKSP